MNENEFLLGTIADGVNLEGGTFEGTPDETEFLLGKVEDDSEIEGLIYDPSGIGVPGPQGPAGTSYQEEFETISKNLKSWNASFNYTGSQLTSIVYTDGILTITKTLNYSSGILSSIVLSGNTPLGINLTKTLGYIGPSLSTITFS